MNISKFTQKSVEAVQGCEKLAYEYGNQQIDQEHLLVVSIFKSQWRPSRAARSWLMNMETSRSTRSIFW